MRMIKLLGLALMATLAFSVVGAIGAGSASALLFLTESGKALLFLVESLTKPLLSTPNANNKIECGSVLGHGFILDKSDEARKILLTFHECKSVAGTCKTEPAGTEDGLIKTLELDALLVTLLASLDKYGLLILGENPKEHLAKFTCGVIPITVLGLVVGKFEESLKESEALKETKLVEFNHELEQWYWTLEGVQLAILHANIGGIVEKATQQVLVHIKADGGVRLCSKNGTVCPD